ncbi:MAG: proline dehydrogenase family protein [Lewinella sp.]|nr:proline dehydrogenase family protein [Lewinella sp.]
MSRPGLVRLGERLARWALHNQLPVKWLVKPTIYQHFCGGENLQEVMPVIDRLGKHGIRTILDYGVEAKETEPELEQTASFLIRTLEAAAADEDVHIISTKLTGLFQDILLEKVTAGETLTATEQADYERGRSRLRRISEAAHAAGVGLHIDAEESWKQGAIDQLAWEMSALFNHDKPIIINAVQLYRTDRLEFLRQSLEDARRHGYLCAVKLVRGAYMEKERARATQLRYPSPIHATLEATHAAYNQALRFCLDNLGEMYVCNATHNEASCRLQVQLMAERNIRPTHPLVATAQLYGMSDNLSFNMARHGYNVEKYLPYGPVREVIPYLIRRTQENTSVGGQMSRELNLLSREMKRRGLVG